MGYTLLDNPNPHLRQYRGPRRERPSGVVVVHTAESAPDLSPPDDGAERVAAWISGRTDPGSYHRLCDADSIVACVPWWFEAWHDGTGTNPHSTGISAATRADQWSSMPQWWRDGCVTNMARAAADFAAWVEAEHSIVVPPRRITEAEARARVPGFISHGELDPGRRSDPGAHFPWEQFLDLYARMRTTQEDDMAQADVDAITQHQLELHQLENRYRAEIEQRLSQRIVDARFATTADIVAALAGLDLDKIADALAHIPDLDLKALEDRILTEAARRLGQAPA